MEKINGGIPADSKGLGNTEQEPNPSPKLGEEALDGLHEAGNLRKVQILALRLQVWVLSPAGSMVPNKSQEFRGKFQSCPMSWIQGEKLSLEP